MEQLVERFEKCNDKLVHLAWVRDRIEVGDIYKVLKLDSQREKDLNWVSRYTRRVEIVKMNVLSDIEARAIFLRGEISVKICTEI